MEKFRKILFSESSKLSKVVSQPRSQVTLGLPSLANVLKGSGLRWHTALKNLPWTCESKKAAKRILSTYFLEEPLLHSHTQIP